MKIYKTTNYNLFRKLNGNRSIDKLNLDRIVKSMRDKFLITPIDVNQKMEVIDGQHRLEACKITNNPVYYVIQDGWGLMEAHRLNANQKNWTTEQYLQGYCDAGNDNYVKFRNLLNNNKDFPFNVIFSISLGLVNRSAGSHFTDFKNGKYIYYEIGAQNILNKLRLVKQYNSVYNSARFITALLIAMRNKQFNFDEFLQKLSYQSTKIVKCSTSKQYLEIIENIYNYRRRDSLIRLF